MLTFSKLFDEDQPELEISTEQRQLFPNREKTDLLFAYGESRSLEFHAANKGSASIWLGFLSGTPPPSPPPAPPPPPPP